MKVIYKEPNYVVVKTWGTFGTFVKRVGHTYHIMDDNRGEILELRLKDFDFVLDPKEVCDFISKQDNKESAHTVMKDFCPFDIDDYIPDPKKEHNKFLKEWRLRD